MTLRSLNTGGAAVRGAIKAAGLLALALIALFSLAPSSALAVPVLGVKIQHETDPLSETPGSITRADQVYKYGLSFTNTGTTAEINVGTQLSCTTGNWLNIPASPTFNFRWTRNGVDIPGATSNQYTAAAADASTSLQCVVSLSNATGTGQATSAPVSVGTPSSPPPPAPPAALAAPTGTIAAGQEITCNAGTWTNAPTSYTYQFYRNGSPIGPSTTTAATSAKYLITAENVASPAAFQCSVIGSNVSGPNGATSIKILGAPRSTSPGPTPPMPIQSTSGVPVINTAPATVEVSLPLGVSVEGINALGWTCTKVVPVKCTSAGGPAAGATPYQPIAISVFLDGTVAANEPTASATISGGGALVGATAQDTFNLLPYPLYGASSFSADSLTSLGAPYTQAGGHPYLGTSFNTFTKYIGKAHKLVPIEDPKTISVELPPGFLGNPLRLPKCDSDVVVKHLCPPESQVGTIRLAILNGTPETSGVFALKPTGGHPAEFAFLAASVGEIHLFPTVRSDSDYGITMTSPDNTQAQLRFVEFKFWGTPADPSHDSERCIVGFTSCSFGGAPSSAPLRALLTNPTNCGPQVSTLVTDSWQHPGQFVKRGYEAPPTTGCATLNNLWTGSAKPSISFQTDNPKADTPAGYNINIHVPQEGLADPNALATPDLYGSTFKLPEGLAINASAGNGLQSCSEEQMGLTSTSPIHFNLDSPTCPDKSKVGTMEVQTPMLADPLHGSVFLADQDDNPFKSRFAMYLTIDDKVQGLMLKLAGRVDADPVTGQLTATFLDNPQLPFTDLRLHFFEDSRASLVNPSTCGTYTATAALTPWSAVDPAHPTAAETANPSDSFAISSAPNGGACATTKAGLPFAPTLDAGTLSTKAGADTPFVMKLTRQDGEQELDAMDLTIPKGLTASLKGVPYCSEAQIAAAKAKSSGKAEQASPSCPAASKIGTVTTSAGAGSDPLYVNGNAYLAGPYKGAPLSLAIVTPAVAGPFDFGNVVVRAALQLDPVTAQITVKTDQIPHMLAGVPLQVRSVAVKVDRSGFIRNPTNCTVASVGATLHGVNGKAASSSSRFQVGDCSSLDFSPKLALNLKGGTKRNDHPALTATLTQPEGQANIGSVSVALPHSEFLDQAHIRTVCTRVQFAAKACPAGAIYGSAEAWSPLLDQPLTGPVYLRSSDNKLPDLVVALRGPDSQPIEIELAGRIDSVNGGIRNSFELVPDAAVSKFVLKMQGGKKGLLVNSRDICKRTEKATARIIGQNGKRADQFPKLSNSCKKKPAKKANKANRKARR